MKKDRIIQYKGWNVEFCGLTHWDSLGFAGYHVYETEPDEESISFGSLDDALDWIEEEMDDREFDDEQKNITNKMIDCDWRTLKM